MTLGLKIETATAKRTTNSRLEYSRTIYVERPHPFLEQKG